MLFEPSMKTVYYDYSDQLSSAVNEIRLLRYKRSVI